MGKLRSWKAAEPSRSSASNIGPGTSQTWAKRQKDRAERATNLAAQHAVDDQIRAHKLLARERREEKEKKREDNKAMGLQYQVISDTKKIKKMSRKQLKLISKADTTGDKPIMQRAPKVLRRKK